MNSPHSKDLNHTCDCVPMDRARIENTIFNLTPNPRMPAMLSERPNYFAKTAVFLSEEDKADMLTQIGAIERTVASKAFTDMIFNRTSNPTNAVQTKTRGAFMGYDFHITAEGPRLIEINSNAGGAFIVDALNRTLGSGSDFDKDIGGMFRKEWSLSGRDGHPRTLAIVDTKPESQFHYPDMCLAAESLRRSGFQVVIADPAQFSLRDDGLYIGRLRIDIIYNRLTDFDLSDPMHTVLYEALIQDAAVITPHPRHHALFADKRNLALLSHPESLEALCVPKPDRDSLLKIPSTQVVTTDNQETLWAARKSYYFKPWDGFGSRATFRGAKLTTKVWKHITTHNYVAQAVIPPPFRLVSLDDAQVKLKYDVRVYTYTGSPLLLAARVYQGQTTNLRTEGGGLAPVITLNADALKNAC